MFDTIITYFGLFILGLMVGVILFIGVPTALDSFKMSMKGIKQPGIPERWCNRGRR